MIPEGSRDDLLSFISSSSFFGSFNIHYISSPSSTDETATLVAFVLITPRVGSDRSSDSTRRVVGESKRLRSKFLASPLLVDPFSGGGADINESFGKEEGEPFRYSFWSRDVARIFRTETW